MYDLASPKEPINIHLCVANTYLVDTQTHLYDYTYRISYCIAENAENSQFNANV